MASKLSVSEKCQIKGVKILNDRVLGTGSYGVVYVAIYHGTKVAAKKLHGIFFEGVSPAEFKGILHSWKQELELMSSLRHPNIVQFYGMFNSRDSSSLELSGDSYIITELMAKSLQARNLEPPRLNFRQIVDIVMGISSGLCYLHNRDQPIMHRDLASKNILLSEFGQAKIADLGVAKITLNAQASHTRHPGTDLYMPVESVIGSDNYDHSIDLYGLGVIILELAIGRDPTATQCLKRVNNRIEVVPEIERRQKDFDELDQSCNKELECVIMFCLRDKETRITATGIVEYLEKIRNSVSYQSCSTTPIFDFNKTMPTISGVYEDNSKLSADLEASKEKISNLMKENNKLTAKLDHLQKQFQDKLKTKEDKFQQLSNKYVELEDQFKTNEDQFQQLSKTKAELEDKLKTKEKEMEKLKHQLDNVKNYYEAKLNELHQKQHNQQDVSMSNTNSFLHPTYHSPQSKYGQQLSNSPKSLPERITGHISARTMENSTQLNDQRLTYQRSHSANAQNYSTQLSDKPSVYQRSHSAYAESHAVMTIPTSDTFNPTVRQRIAITREQDTEQHTDNCSSLPTTYSAINSAPPLINYSDTYGHRYSHDQASRSPLYQHQHESDHFNVAHQFHSIPSPQMVTPNNVVGYNTAQLSSSAPQLTVREADEYLSYQVSCMDRVIGQLMNPNNSNNLQSSFVQTLKEQIIKTDNYISNLPFLLRNVGNPINRIECQLNKLLTLNIHVTYGDRRALDEVIYHLQSTISN